MEKITLCQEIPFFIEPEDPLSCPLQPPIRPYLSQVNAIHAPKLHFPQIHFNSILQPTRRLQSDLFLFSLQT